MKKTLLILLTILFLSCTSLPDPHTTNTGMVVFAHDLKNDAHIEIFGYYIITIEKVGTEKLFKRKVPTKTGVVKFFLEPGLYKVSKLEFTYTNGAGSSDLSQYANNISPFLVREGEITLMDKILKTFTKTEGGKSWMFYGIYDITRSDKNNTKAQLADLDGFEMWEFK